MIEVQHIGRASLPKRVRAWLNDLLGSAYVAHLERELLQAKVERDRIIGELRTENRELLNRLLAMSRVAPIVPARTEPTNKATAPGPTAWQQLQAQAIADNAKAEAEELAQKTKSQEN
jgi:hypothetical protein